MFYILFWGGGEREKNLLRGWRESTVGEGGGFPGRIRKFWSLVGETSPSSPSLIGENPDLGLIKHLRWHLFP